MADINLGQLTEAINDKADRDINNLSISGFDATKTQVIKNDNGVIKWAAESGGGGGGSYTAGEGIKIENDTISFDGKTIHDGYAEEEYGYLGYSRNIDTGETTIGYLPVYATDASNVANRSLSNLFSDISLPTGGNARTASYLTVDDGELVMCKLNLSQLIRPGVEKQAQTLAVNGTQYTFGTTYGGYLYIYIYGASVPSEGAWVVVRDVYTGYYQTITCMSGKYIRTFVPIFGTDFIINHNMPDTTYTRIAHWNWRYENLQ